jgi:transcriptional regulator
MHPNPQFHHDDRTLAEALIEEVGFGMVFLTTPDGPRVAHTPLHSTGDGAVQFHIARGNAIARHLDGQIALCVINGPDGYVSPRWYADQDQVPTWNYVSLELEGRVRRMDQDGLAALLEDLSTLHEDRLEDDLAPWTMDKLSDAKRRQLMSGIVGFEMEILGWRPTLKLSQNKPGDERRRVADGLEASGHPAIAQLMRTLVP